MHSYVTLPLDVIKPNPRNARTHSKKQVQQIVRSIREFGFATPVLVDESYMLIAGHGRIAAARVLAMATVPALVLSGLSEAKKRALMVADNRIAENAGWDRETLAIELASLNELLADESPDISLTGFEAAEIDILHTDFEETTPDPARIRGSRYGKSPIASAGLALPIRCWSIVKILFVLATDGLRPLNCFP